MNFSQVVAHSEDPLGLRELDTVVDRIKKTAADENGKVDDQANEQLKRDIKNFSMLFEQSRSKLEERETLINQILTT